MCAAVVSGTDCAFRSRSVSPLYVCVSACVLGHMCARAVWTVCWGAQEWGCTCWRHGVRGPLFPPASVSHSGIPRGVCITPADRPTARHRPAPPAGNCSLFCIFRWILATGKPPSPFARSSAAAAAAPGTFPYVAGQASSAREEERKGWDGMGWDGQGEDRESLQA